MKINFKLPVILEDFKSSKRYANKRDQLLSVGNYSTVKGSLSKLSQQDNQNKAYSFKMSIDFVSSNLWTSHYSEYQSFLYDTIEDFHQKGWTYLQISNWLNKGSYLTPRGKEFKATHVWNIHIKKKRSIERFSRKFETEITDLGIDVIDV